MTCEELEMLIRKYEILKTETQILEIKSAHDGCPTRLYDTLSSFSNIDDNPRKAIKFQTTICCRPVVRRHLQPSIPFWQSPKIISNQQSISSQIHKVIYIKIAKLC